MNTDSQIPPIALVKHYFLLLPEYIDPPSFCPDPVWSSAGL